MRGLTNRARTHTMINGLNRIGTLRRISAQTDIPAPGAGLTNAIYQIKLSWGVLDGTNFVVRIAPSGSIFFNLVDEVLKATGMNRIIIPGPIILSENEAMRIDFLNQTGPWQAEFFHVVQPIVN